MRKLRSFALLRMTEEELMEENLHDLIYDWNTAAERPVRTGARKIEFDDETLRDGLQSPSVTDPTLRQTDGWAKSR